MSTSLKQTENEVYIYFTNKFRIGWSHKEVIEYYQTLNYREREVQGKDIKNKLGSILHASDWDDLQRDNKFNIKNFIKKIHGGLGKEDLTLTKSPNLEGFALISDTEFPSKDTLNLTNHRYQVLEYPNIYHYKTYKNLDKIPLHLKNFYHDFELQLNEGLDIYRDEDGCVKYYTFYADENDFKVLERGELI